MTDHEVKILRRSQIADSSTARLERMIEIRQFEDLVQRLFEAGKVHGTTHLAQGQEAVAVGIAAASRPTDQVTATYRGHAVALALGSMPEAVLGEIMGRTIGLAGGIGGSKHLVDAAVGLMPTFAIVGAGLPVAAGAALSAQVRGTDDAAIAIFGDGASNIGAFHEAMNLAAIWNLPVVFICENNIYGEYSRIDTTTPVADIATRADSYGMPGHIVDGMDVDAVATSVTVAIDRARSGGGPTLLEMKTYRFAGHSRADTAPYRPDGELDEWLLRDPIPLYRARLVDGGVVTDDDVAQMESRVADRLTRALEIVEESPRPPVSQMFANVYVGSR